MTIANRRMFSLKIIDSARFLKMPPSTRLLYYDLCMRADDDGVVEGFNVLRMTGATEDDLRVLTSKGFIKVLNEDLVSYIIDWTEHNKIRADRKVDSLYIDLLLKVIPDVPLMESKERADRKKYGTSQGQPMDGIGKDRLGKVIGKDNIGQLQDSTKSCISEKDFNIFEYMQQRGFASISPIIYEKINLDIEKYSLDEVKKAIDIADSNARHTYNYLKGILEKRRAGVNEKAEKETDFKKAMKEFLECN
ncbi:hypothetical protein NRP93_002503 [Clostridium botulinum]|nr:hypothetical protein [Clostridium botulinum]